MPCPAGPWHHGSMATAGRRRDDQTCVGFPRPHFCSPSTSTSTSTSPIPRICHSAPHQSCAIFCNIRRHANTLSQGSQAPRHTSFSLPSHCPPPPFGLCLSDPGPAGSSSGRRLLHPPSSISSVSCLLRTHPPPPTGPVPTRPKACKAKLQTPFLPPRPTTEKTPSPTKWLNTRTLWRTTGLHLVSRRDGFARGAMVATRDDYPDNARLPLEHSYPRFQTSRTRRERWTRI